MCHAPNSLDHYRSAGFLVSIWPEEVWERLALLAGLFHIAALVVHGRSTFFDGHHWRAAASMFSAWFLTYLTMNLLALPITPPGIFFIVVPLGFDLFAIGKNVRRTA